MYAQEIAKMILEKVKNDNRKRIEITLEEIMLKYNCGIVTARHVLKILQLLLKENKIDFEYERGGKLIIKND